MSAEIAGRMKKYLLSQHAGGVFDVEYAESPPVDTKINGEDIYAGFPGHFFIRVAPSFSSSSLRQSLSLPASVTIDRRALTDDASRHVLVISEDSVIAHMKIPTTPTQTTCMPVKPPAVRPPRA